MSAAFDTLSVARDLEAAGIDRNHAEAIAKAVHHGDKRAATKADLDTATTSLRATTKADLDTAVAALRTEIAKQETRLTWKALGIAALIVLVLGTLRFLPI